MSEREAANSIEKGSRRYKEKIHRESKYADTHKNLTYTFSKPKKGRPSNIHKVCESCEHDIFVNEYTISAICSACGYLNRFKQKK